MRVLTVNVGSSNVKLRVLDEADRELWTRTFDVGDHSAHPDAVKAFLVGAPEVDAVGHRLVHGGPRFRDSTLATDEVIAELRALGGLAPLHNEASLNLLKAAREALPDLPHVVCFDTSFHRTLPEEAAVYPVPRHWTEAGMRRYGFHGLSFAHAGGRAAEILGQAIEKLRLASAISARALRSPPSRVGSP